MATSEARIGTLRFLGGDDFGDVIESNDVVLVEFYTDWCGTCQRMRPVLQSLIADTETAILTVDVESHLETAIEYGAQRTPTFVVFVAGQPVKRLRGRQSEATLRDLIETYRP